MNWTEAKYEHHLKVLEWKRLKELGYRAYLKGEPRPKDHWMYLGWLEAREDKRTTSLKNGMRGARNESPYSKPKSRCGKIRLIS